jgi:hypothetical protein
MSTHSWVLGIDAAEYFSRKLRTHGHSVNAFFAAFQNNPVDIGGLHIHTDHSFPKLVCT